MLSGGSVVMAAITAMIVMICIAATGLLLKMISVLMDRNHKP